MSKTVKQLRTELMDVFNDLKSGAIDVKVAAEMNNTAGKIINTVRAELEYATLRNVEPSIEFMDNKETEEDKVISNE